MTDISTVCIYCGSSNDTSARHRDAARQLGEILAENGIGLVYGGGHVGLMGIAADAVLANGGAVTGVIPDFLRLREVGHAGLTELMVTETMHERKTIMVDRSDAFVILPGGIGTMDEAFEILSWKQLGLHDKPVLFVDIDGYWKPLIALADHMLAEGYIRPRNREMFRTVSDVSEVLPALRGTASDGRGVRTEKL